MQFDKWKLDKRKFLYNDKCNIQFILKLKLKYILIFANSLQNWDYGINACNS